MRWWKRMLLGFVAFAMLFFTLVVGGAALLWLRPEILFNEHRIRQALHWVPEWKVDWRRFDLQFKPLGWKGKRISLVIEGLAVDREGALHASVNRLELAASMRWQGFHPKLTQVDRLVADFDEIKIPASPETENAPAGPLPDLRPPAFRSIYPEELRLGLLREVSLSVRRLELESREGTPLLLHGEFKSESVTEREASFTLEARAAQTPSLNALLRAKFTLEPALPRLSAKAKAEGNLAGWRGDFPFTIVWDDSIRLQGSPDLRSRPHHLDTDISLAWRAQGLELRLGSFASNTIWKQGRLETRECNLSSSFTASGFPKTAEFRCGLTARPKNRLIPTLRAEVSGNAGFKVVSDQEFRLAFSLNEHSADSFLISRLDAKGELSLRGGKIHDPALNLELSARIPKFRAWKEAWEGTPLAIPAPFHVMDGPIELKLSSKISDEKLLTADTSLTSGLASATQSFVTESTGALRIEDPLSDQRRISIDARAKLKDVRLEAPPLRIEEPPQFLPDKRFVTTAELAKEEKAEKAARAENKTPTLQWKVAIESEKPVRVRTNLMPAEVPVAVNLNLGSAAPMDGYLEIQPMPIKVFSKKAQLDKLRVSFVPGSKYAGLDGRLDYRTPEVLIKILLLGNTDTPRVEFESEPPLSRQQIVSVLLFNKSLAELSEEEVSSTQNMSQALSDGALGLFSLFFLSSTPIQSVGYDPVTQSYSARVSLGGKTTLSVGSDFVEAREFGLRRQLGGPWAIRTELRQEQDRPDVVLTLLEWFKRF